jgi:hypothetical protein
MPGLAADAREPCADGWEVLQIEVTFIGDMGVSIERDVGDSESLGNEETAFGFLARNSRVWVAPAFVSSSMRSNGKSR